jgi:peroxiredoxin
LAAISYDGQDILKDFAERHQIDFPLLPDSDSRIIRSFNVLNAEATGKEKGMAHPGFFYIDSSGVIREKYFEAKYTDRIHAEQRHRETVPRTDRGSERKDRSASSSADT